MGRKPSVGAFDVPRVESVGGTRTEEREPRAKVKRCASVEKRRTKNKVARAARRKGRR